MATDAKSDNSSKRKISDEALCKNERKFILI